MYVKNLTTSHFRTYFQPVPPSFLTLICLLFGRHSC